MKAKIFIAGSGGIGRAAGLILGDSAHFDVELYFGDINAEMCDSAEKYVNDNLVSKISIHKILMPLEGATEAMEKAIANCDIILDCLPGSQAPRMARLALKHHCHYANLTEYVAETNEIIEIAKDADTAFVLQTGLAPGFINVLANRLFEDFTSEYGVEKVDRIGMKVGALSKHAPSPHFYAFTWSPIGVATEYLKDAEIVRNYKKIKVPALSGRHTIIIDGDEYEDNFTSGGAADLPDAFAGRVKDLDYKTLRYPGHYAWVEGALTTIPHGEDKIKSLENIMLENIPSVEDDVVIVYASVQGKDKNGRLRRKEKSYEIYPSTIGNQRLRAIQTSTAAPLCEIAYMMMTKGWKGLKLQSQIPTEEFLNGKIVSRFYGNY
ncbi:MAG TPA: saccharopine dehydrogenase C-terminal domain-containing protein [Saprospiraceae bacterium]|nr:saccharopine dehydrogenase NADP-binding domain-containing protein [Saprospiraceae bacterium]MCB9329309.1 saccharopine dehydrogenase NADP-binding domain-containing protein [Lewinellaceae bacterium]HPQ20816.1 saccharopine dehydrogenase C-terminal domain-containing protein [Saprospiraceae bacterium]